MFILSDRLLHCPFLYTNILKIKVRMEELDLNNQVLFNIVHHTTKGTTGSRNTKLYSSQICTRILLSSIA